MLASGAWLGSCELALGGGMTGRRVVIAIVTTLPALVLLYPWRGLTVAQSAARLIIIGNLLSWEVSIYVYHYLALLGFTAWQPGIRKTQFAEVLVSTQGWYTQIFAFAGWPSMVVAGTCTLVVVARRAIRDDPPRANRIDMLCGKLLAAACPATWLVLFWN